MLAKMYPVRRFWTHPGTGSIPNGKGVKAPSFTHLSKSPSRQQPWSVLIQLEAEMETIIRKNENRNNKNAKHFAGPGFEVVVISVGILAPFLNLLSKFCFISYIIKL